MNREEILATILNLANVQGFYGRLYNAFMAVKENKPENYELIMEKLEAENFEDATDLVLYFEC
jgi:hypothetical protein